MRGWVMTTELKLFSSVVTTLTKTWYSESSCRSHSHLVNSATNEQPPRLTYYGKKEKKKVAAVTLTMPQ